ISLNRSSIRRVLSHRQQHLALGTPGNILQGDPDHRLNAALFLRARRAPGLPAEVGEIKPAHPAHPAWSACRARAAAEKHIEKVAKTRLRTACLGAENILKTGALPRAHILPARRRMKPLGTLILLPILAELVVLLARFRVFEHFVSFGDLLEFILG